MIDNIEQQKPEDTRAVEQGGSYKNSDKNAHHHVNLDRDTDHKKDSMENSKRTEDRQQNIPGAQTSKS